ncbi:MAG TPA: serine/threonine-protein kinase, partial [Thermoanaerobaculia bacterium]|nr:serine/threonine-protein kinase [Thermoanaerobaculia bacterium]
EDGTPYFVMEYIDGLPITRHCDEARRSVNERLRLFLDVCSAVHHAHANLVIHRDLKPGNILVDHEGRAKLLDFGICKLLVRETGDTAYSQSGDFPAMTPEYASPEQVRGDAITVASDVYSLGAVLYQLLTGTRAVRLTERSPQAVEEAVCRQAPRLPSEAARGSRRPGAVARARQLEGDLDEILLRAMQKEPARRYQSAEQLAADLRRHLEHRPVGARPLTPGYRARRFLRRNRVGVAAGLGISVAFSAGLALSARQAREARQDLRKMREADASLVAQLGDSVQAAPDTGTRWELARRTSEYLDRLASRSYGDDSLDLELARAYLRLGELAGGQDRESVALARSTLARARELSDRLLARAPLSRDARDVRERALRRLARLGAP